MKKTRKGLMPALLGAVCSVVALTSVSYAWFTIGNQANIGQLDVNVQSADGMQISANASDWKSSLPIAELQKTELGNQFVSELKPVSTDGKISSGVHNMFKGTVEADGGISAVAHTSDYVYFDFYVRLDSDKKLSLANNSYVIAGATDKDSELAVRVSFVNEGVVTNGKVEDAQKLLNGTSAVIWEPNVNEHNKTNTNNGMTGPKTYEGVNSAITYVNNKYVPETRTGDDPLTKDLVEEEYTTTYAHHFSAVDTKKPAYNNTNGKTTESLDLFDLKAGINKVRVYIWLEGQDVDCTNEVSAGSISVGLNFSVPQTVTDVE